MSRSFAVRALAGAALVPFAPVLVPVYGFAFAVSVATDVAFRLNPALDLNTTTDPFITRLRNL